MHRAGCFAHSNLVHLLCQGGIEGTVCFLTRCRDSKNLHQPLPHTSRCLRVERMFPLALFCRLNRNCDPAIVSSTTYIVLEMFQGPEHLMYMVALDVRW